MYVSAILHPPWAVTCSPLPLICPVTSVFLCKTVPAFQIRQLQQSILDYVLTLLV